MDPIRIRELLNPFTAHLELSEPQILEVSTYLDLLLKWNAKMNLTAVREPEAIVQRHFGESLFSAGVIASNCARAESLADVGSGAGFPGLPIKIAAPQLNLTLVESQQKKATFLREVIRELKLPGAQVLNVRAEAIEQPFDIVTLRAVESFDKVLPIASRLVRTGGALVLLIGDGQTKTAESLLRNFQWDEPHPVPMSDQRVIFIGAKT
jgi:16S rRNA (guanine527-N7)-methyltransferase